METWSKDHSKQTKGCRETRGSLGRERRRVWGASDITSRDERQILSRTNVRVHVSRGRAIGSEAKDKVRLFNVSEDKIRHTAHDDVDIRATKVSVSV